MTQIIVINENVLGKWPQTHVLRTNEPEITADMIAKYLDCDESELESGEHLWNHYQLDELEIIEEEI